MHLQRRGDTLALCRFALLDAPIFEKTITTEMLTEHLRAVSQALETKSKQVSLTTGVNDAVVRHVEMPRIPLDDMRMILKHNTKNYLQQDLANHAFDCHMLPSGAAVATKADPQPQTKSLLPEVSNN
ncbi:MAG: hypothetical protein QM813_04490 [Verrucomicrobiota bacterium]